MGPHGKLGRQATHSLRCGNIPATGAMAAIGCYQAVKAFTRIVFAKQPDAIVKLVDVFQIDLAYRDCALSRQRVPKKSCQHGTVKARIGVMKRQTDERAAQLGVSRRQG